MSSARRIKELKAMLEQGKGQPQGPWDYWAYLWNIFSVATADK